MSAHRALSCTLLASLVLLATACSKTSDEAATNAAASAAAEASQAASPATGEAASTAASPSSDAAAASASGAASTAASAPAPAPEDAARAAIAPPVGMPAGPAPVLDTDYTVIDTPDSPTSNKIQVTEVFGYGCPHCNALQPHIAAWEQKLPSDVDFQYMPAAFGSDPQHCWDDFARAYYAGHAMGVLPKNHDAIYKAVWDPNRSNPGCSSIPGIFAKFGADEKTFASTMMSFAVTAKVSAAHEQVVRWAVTSTPTLVIDGKYRVIELGASGPDGMFHTAEWLIAKERQDRAKH